MSFFPYETVSAFFEAEGDFAENLEEDDTDLFEEDEDPCCLLYRQPYLEDHEWGCPRRVAKDRV